nr:uncharacterized protein LOC122606355 isoform X2 [Erigeron canadensis]
MQMDICSHIGMPVNDVSSLHGYYMDVDTLESSCRLMGDFSVDELAYDAAKFLNIHDDVEVGSASIPTHEHVISQIKDECEEAHLSSIITEARENLFNKCATFSCSSKMLSSSAAFVGGELKGGMNDADDVITREVSTHDDNAESIDPHCSSTQSLPNPMKPVSAMKGSREKRGAAPPNKLTVKWAPDVYDPIPAPSLHTSINRPHKQGKKKYKIKQKNGSKSSRGSKGKDKKQVHKSMGFKLFEHKQEVIHVSEIQTSAIDFHLGMPDLFCGGTFVDRYGASFHLSSTAEAT